MGFLEGMTYTRNCYSCPYAGADRVSDLTLGDSWGSELDPTELHRGISLFLVQTRKGEELIGQAALKTCPADAESAVQHNAQLREPMRMPKNRERFFTLLRSGSFNRAVAKCLPKFVMKQKVKAALIKTKLIGR